MIEPMNNIKVFLIVVAVALFFIGYHNIDLYYNYHNLAVADKTVSGIEIEIDDLYFNGQRVILCSLILLIVSNFITNKFYDKFRKHL